MTTSLKRLLIFWIKIAIAGTIVIIVNGVCQGESSTDVIFRLIIFSYSTKHILSQPQKAMMMQKIKVTDSLKKVIDQSSRPVQELIFHNLQDMCNKLEAIKHTVPGHLLADRVHQFMEQYVSGTAKDPRVGCKKGCAFCCAMNVDVATAEAQLLVEYSKISGIVIDQDKLKRQTGHSRDTWKELSAEDRKCVFLKDNLCSVYAARPANCRKYFSSTPKLCEDPLGQTMVVVDNKAEIIASAMYNVMDSGSMADLLLNELNKSGDGKKH